MNVRIEQLIGSEVDGVFYYNIRTLKGLGQIVFPIAKKGYGVKIYVSKNDAAALGVYVSPIGPILQIPTSKGTTDTFLINLE